MPLPDILGKLTWTWSGGTLDLQTAKVYFDVFSGYDEYPEVRGEDDVIPGLSGRYRRNRIDDVAIVELRGHIRGVGATKAARAADFRASVVAVKAALDPTGSGGTLAVLTPYLGVPSGSKSIVGYPLSPGLLGGPLENYMSYARYSIEIEAIGNPPRWA
jgi:hypothetical protein